MSPRQRTVSILQVIRFEAVNTVRLQITDAARGLSKISNISQISNVRRPPSQLICIKARHRVTHLKKDGLTTRCHHRRSFQYGDPDKRRAFHRGLCHSFFASRRLRTTILISTVEFVALFLSNPEGLNGMGVSSRRRGVFGAENGR
jgi:hypothetical protein